MNTTITHANAPSQPIPLSQLLPWAAFALLLFLGSPQNTEFFVR
ncbi:hypothetical protein [Burkholderia vietnamiensis]|jgi:hypothetical protein|nr:hypothetical protein [Burkholderia vietnamiensis]